MNATKRTPVDSPRPLHFHIEEAHVGKAACSDPQQCVIAQAVRDAIGSLFDEIHVGASITKILADDKVIRYATPAKLRKALITFDKTGRWDLPPGKYTLAPPSPSQRKGGRESRWGRKYKKRTKPGKDVFRGRALPTRKVVRADTLACAAALIGTGAEGVLPSAPFSAARWI